jgi:tetratricopeptide (TPR) repeat protein
MGQAKQRKKLMGESYGKVPNPWNPTKLDLSNWLHYLESSGELAKIAQRQKNEREIVMGHKVATLKELLEIGIANASQGSDSEAIVCLSKAIEIDNTLADAYLHRGVCLTSWVEESPNPEYPPPEVREEMLQQALGDYKKAIELNPNLQEAHEQLEYWESVMNISEEFVYQEIAVKPLPLGMGI